MKGYKEIVLKASEGITFDVKEGRAGELIVSVINTSLKNYANPPIPEGYKHILGEWDTGFVIKRLSDGSEFVWIPVGYLDSNGTLDGKTFTEKFGRRNYMKDKFSLDEFYEEVTIEFAMQILSVEKYGGFYISRYDISKNQETDEACSVKGKKPWTGIDYNESMEVAFTFEKRESIKSHLTFGAEYDSVLEWLLESKVRTDSDIIEDSSNWGNYFNKNNFLRILLETGRDENWCANNIYDLAGNVDEWTQEQYETKYSVTRGGNFSDNGYDCPAADRGYRDPDQGDNKIGFRIALYIK